jgi:hypothetical protein
MVVLDGHAYQVQGTGRVSKPAPTPARHSRRDALLPPNERRNGAGCGFKDSRTAATGTGIRATSSMRSAWMGTSVGSAPVL